MSLIWFRFHAEALDNPRVQGVPDHLFKAWVNLQCILSQEGMSASGKLPDVKEVAFRLRISVEKSVRILEDLCDAGLLKSKSVTLCNENGNESVTLCNENGSQKSLEIFPEKKEYFLKNWEKKQYKSDSSSDRVKRYRQRHSNVTVTSPDQIRKDTDQIRSEGDFLDLSEDKKKKAGAGEVPRVRTYPGDYDIQRHLTDDELDDCRSLAPGWDMQTLFAGFNAQVKQGRFTEPQYPFLAFKGWVANFTKGKKP